MIEVSAITLFLIGVAVGVVIGAFAVILFALKYKGENNGKEK